MEQSLNCHSCAAQLFSRVPYCPFCGAASALAHVKKPVPAPDKPAPVVTPAPAVTAGSADAGRSTSEAGNQAGAPTPAPKPAAAPQPQAQPQPKPAAAPTPAPPQAQPAKSGVPPRQNPAPQPGPGAAAKKAKGGKLKWIILLLIVGYVLMRVMGGADDEQKRVTCVDAKDQGMALLKSGNLNAAAMQARIADSACSAENRAHYEELQQALAQAEAKETACQRSYREIDEHLQTARLQSAREQLNGLTRPCTTEAEAKALRKQLTQAQAAEKKARSEFSKALSAKDPTRAQQALEALEAANRENPELDKLREQAAALLMAGQSDTPAEIDVSNPARFIEQMVPEAAPLARQVERAQQANTRTSTQPASQNASQNAAQKSMATMFLRDAEQALAQQRFDAAKTFVESARRVDPANPRIDSLARQIREQERALLQDETTIR